MKKIIHKEEININEGYLLRTDIRTGEVYIGTLLQKINDGYHKNLYSEIAQIVAYYETKSTMEDARPFWKIEYFSYPELNTKELLQMVLDNLIKEKLIYEPAWIRGVKTIKPERGETINFQKGRIFPEDK